MQEPVAASTEPYTKYGFTEDTFTKIADPNFSTINPGFVDLDDFLHVKSAPTTNDKLILPTIKAQYKELFNVVDDYDTSLTAFTDALVTKALDYAIGVLKAKNPEEMHKFIDTY